MPSAKSGSAARKVVTIVMDLLVAAVVVLVVHLVVSFFGTLSGASWGAGVLKLTRLAVVPMGFEAIATPYGGVFDVNAAITSLALMAGEWVLGLVRRTV